MAQANAGVNTTLNGLVGIIRLQVVHNSGIDVVDVTTLGLPASGYASGRRPGGRRAGACRRTAGRRSSRRCGSRRRCSRSLGDQFSPPDARVGRNGARGGLQIASTAARAPGVGDIFAVCSSVAGLDAGGKVGDRVNKLQIIGNAVDAALNEKGGSTGKLVSDTVGAGTSGSSRRDCCRSRCSFLSLVVDFDITRVGQERRELF